MLDGPVVVQALLMVIVLDGVLQLDVLGVLCVKKHVLRKDVDDREDGQHL